MKRVATTLALCLGFHSSAVLAADSDVPAPAGSPAMAEANGSPSDFEAKELVCKNGSNVRKVKLGYADIKTGSDCKVSYLKETEQPGEEKVLWNARNDGKFCQQQAQGFVDKLKGQGWNCE